MDFISAENIAKKYSLRANQMLVLHTTLFAFNFLIEIAKKENILIEEISDEILIKHITNKL